MRSVQLMMANCLEGILLCCGWQSPVSCSNLFLRLFFIWTLVSLIMPLSFQWSFQVIFVFLVGRDQRTAERSLHIQCTSCGMVFSSCGSSKGVVWTFGVSKLVARNFNQYPPEKQAHIGSNFERMNYHHHEVQLHSYTVGIITVPEVTLPSCGSILFYPY